MADYGMVPATNPEDSTVEERTAREQFRRLHYVLETHPMLSGMMTNEHQDILRNLWEDHIGSRYFGPYPGGEEPNYHLDLTDIDAPED